MKPKLAYSSLAIFVAIAAFVTCRPVENFKSDGGYVPGAKAAVQIALA